MTTEARELLHVYLTDRRRMIEECFRITPKDVEHKARVPFLFNGVSELYWKLRYEKKADRILGMKARQVHFSSTVQTDFTSEWMTTPGMNVLNIVQKDKPEVIRPHMNRVKGFIASTPDWLKPPLINETERELIAEFAEGPKARDKYQSRFVFTSIGSQDFGRGETFHRVHITEYGLYNAEEAKEIDDMLLGLPKGAVVVKEGSPKGTANALYSDWQRAKQGIGLYAPLLIYWWLNEEYQMEGEPLGLLTPYEVGLTERHNLSEAQIRWRRHMIRAAESTHGAKAESHFQQEYLEDDESCFITPGDSPFDVVFLRKLLQEAKPPNLWSHGDKVRYRIGPEPGENYVLGLDTSEGLASSHDSTGTLRNARNGNLCAVIQGIMDPKTLAGVAIDVATQYNMALIVPERESHGHAVVAVLVERNYPFIFRFYRKVFDKGDDQLGLPVRGIDLKPLYMGDLVQRVNSQMYDCWDAPLIQQLLRVQETITLSGGDERAKYETGVLDLVSAELCTWQGMDQARRISSIRAPSEPYGFGRRR